MNSTNPFSFNPVHIVFTECIIGIGVNVLLLLVIVLDPLGRLRKRGWITITNLALADLVTCVATIWLSQYDTVERLTVGINSPATFSYALLYLGYSLSFFMLFVLSIEVYVATKYPLQSKLILTNKRVVCACVFSWLVAVLIGSCNFWTDRFPSEPLIACITILEIFVLAVIFFRILTVFNIRRSRQEISELVGRKSHTNGLTITFFLLFFVFLVTAFPYFVGEQVHFLYHTLPEWNIAFDHKFISIYLPIAYLNFIANPFIYAWRIPAYRQALVVLLTCRKRRFGAQPAAMMPRSETENVVFTVLSNNKQSKTVT